MTTAPAAWIVVGIHALVAAALFFEAWFFEDVLLYVVVAVPLSQCSLISIFAATTGSPLWTRYATACGGIIAAWFLLRRILIWGVGSDVPAAWAMGLTVHALAIVIGTQIYRIASSYVKPSQASTHSQESVPRFRFNLATIFLWTIVMAVGFALVRFGQVHWQWTPGFFLADQFARPSLIGLAGSTVSLSLVWVKLAQAWWMRGLRFIASLVLTLLITLFWPETIRTMLASHWVIVGTSLIGFSKFRSNRSQKPPLGPV